MLWDFRRGGDLSWAYRVSSSTVRMRASRGLTAVVQNLDLPGLVGIWGRTMNKRLDQKCFWLKKSCTLDLDIVLYRRKMNGTIDVNPGFEILRLWKGIWVYVLSRKAFSCSHCLMCSEGKDMHASEFVILFIVTMPCFINALYMNLLTPRLCDKIIQWNPETGIVKYNLGLTEQYYYKVIKVAPFISLHKSVLGLSTGLNLSVINLEIFATWTRH